MIPPPQPDSITFTFLLGGKSVCGQEQRPDRCEDCSEMPNCVLDCFYDALSKGVGCASQSSAPTEREPQCLCETCCMTVEQCRGQQLRQASPAPTEQDERDKVLDKICKICPLLDERPEICEECVVYSVRTPTPEAQR